MIKYSKYDTKKLKDVWIGLSCNCSNIIHLSTLLDMFKVDYSKGKFKDSSKVRCCAFFKTLITSILICLSCLLIAVYRSLALKRRSRKSKKVKSSSRIIIVNNEFSNKTNHLLKLKKTDDFLISIDNIYGTVCKHNADIGSRDIISSDIVSSVFEFFGFIIKVGLWSKETKGFSEKLTFSEQARCYMKVIRGLCYFKVLSRKLLLNKKHILFFAHSGMADTNILELSIQRNFGCKTCHVLHGVSPGFDFYSFSSLYLCNNPVDSNFFSQFSRGLCFIHSLFLYEEPKFNSLSNEKVLIATNIIHPSNSRFPSTLVDAEMNLLVIAYNALKKDQCTIYWRPHPRIKDFDDSVLHKMKVKCKELGFIFDDMNLRDSINNSSLVISNESTVIVDSILLKTPFAMFSFNKPDESTLYGKLSKTYQFKDKESLIKVISLYKDEGDN